VAGFKLESMADFRRNHQLGTAGVGAVEIMRRTVTSKTCVWRRQ
jgi:hypothetical protein